MERLKARLRKLEQATGSAFETLYLPDGSQVRYHHDELLQAFGAVVNRAEHWLHPVICASGEDTGIAGLIWALLASEERLEEEDNG